MPSNVHAESWRERTADWSFMPRDSGYVPNLGSITRPDVSKGQTFVSTIEHLRPSQGIYLEEYNGRVDWPNSLRPDQPGCADVTVQQHSPRLGTNRDVLFLEAGGDVKTLDQVTRPYLTNQSTFTPSNIHDGVHPKAQAAFLRETGNFAETAGQAFRPGLAHGDNLLHTPPKPNATAFLREDMSVPPLADHLRPGVTKGRTFMSTETHDQLLPEYIQDFSGFAEHVTGSLRPGMKVGSTFMPSNKHAQSWESPFSSDVRDVGLVRLNDHQ